MRRCLFSFWIGLAVGLAGWGCAETNVLPETQTGGSGTTTQPAGGVPTTSQPASIPGPQYTASLLDPLYESSAGARAVATGDIDNDGQMDVASISGPSQPVQIHLNGAAAGDFDTISIAGGAPLSSLVDVALADLNRDDKLDLVVLADDTGLSAASNQGALILLIQGDDPRKPSDWTQVPEAGSTPPDNLTFPGSAGEVTDLVVGDTDGINGPDVVVASSDSVRLFVNPGDEQAKDKTAWVSTLIETDLVGPAQVELTDLDGDGDQDVVMCDPGANSFNVRWLQNPLLEAATDEESPVPTYMSDLVDPLFESTAGPKAVAIGDINGDGLIDAASISDENQSVQIHLQNAQTGMFDMVSVGGGSPLVKMVDIELADFDSDGRVDIAVLVNDSGLVPPKGCGQRGTLALLFQGADPSDPNQWTPSYLWFCTNATGLTDMAVGDFDGQAGPDVMVAANMSVVDSTSEVAESDIITVVKTAEITDPPNCIAYLFTNPGPGGATDPSLWGETAVHGDLPAVKCVEVADVDGDGDEEVVVAYPTAISLNLRWLRNPLSESGVDAVTGGQWDYRMVGQQQGGADVIAVGDVDGDGDVDVAASHASLGLTQWFRNPGPGALVAGAPQVPWDVFNVGELDEEVAGTAQITQLQLVDLDSDGQLDCFVTAEFMAVGFRSQENIEHVWDSFLITNTDPVAQIGRVAFADFDGDGKLDFLAPLDREGLTEDRIAIYTSVANSLWRRRLVGQQDGGANFIALGDVDGDGYLDVAAAHASLSLSQWFRNPGSTSLAPDAPQLPWEVFNIGETDTLASGQISQLQLLDLDGDGQLDCFVTVTGGDNGTAAGFEQQTNVEDYWTPFLIFATNPVAEIGRVGFADFNQDGQLDFVAPLDREGLTQDQFLLFLSGD